MTQKRRALSAQPAVIDACCLIDLLASGQAEAIRAWAKAQGMDVKRAGRLPAAVIRTYQEQAHHD